MAWGNPYGYGDEVLHGRTTFDDAGLTMEHWTPNVLRLAQPNLVFAKSIGLMEAPDAFGKGVGGTFTIPIFDYDTDAHVLTAASALTEGTSISLGSQTYTSVSMVLQEYGFGYGWYDMIDYMTNVNFRAQVDMTAADKMARILNYLHSQIYYQSQWQIARHAGMTAGSFHWGSDALGAAHAGTHAGTGELTHGIIDFAVDTLRTSKVPTDERGLYHVIGHAKTFRNIKADAKFENRDLYTRNGQKALYQILGEYNGCLWIEATDRTYVGTTIITGRNVGGYGFGKQPAAVYYDDYKDDAGRAKAIKARVVFGYGETLRDAGTTCIVIYTGTDAGQVSYYDY